MCWVLPGCALYTRLRAGMMKGLDFAKQKAGGETNSVLLLLSLSHGFRRASSLVRGSLRRCRAETEKTACRNSRQAAVANYSLSNTFCKRWVSY